MSQLTELYQEVILDHYRNPRNAKPIEKETHSAEGHNPLCGDDVEVHLLIEDGVVADVSVRGVGCAISTASSSLMSEAIRGKSLDEVEQMFERFHAMVTSPIDAPAPIDGLGKLEVLAGVRNYPVRIKCATLPWHALKSAIAGSSEPVTTEAGE
ncbi:MAG: SUF system NifU family Fe-S cluster assembly protein [Fimbriimonadales bacterium]|nr:SUF system NifU family Fe-S cluster assembly protein [Fimbriimonadales bacterium]